jgi:hypothetical protein
MCQWMGQMGCRSWKHPKGRKLCVTPHAILSPDGARCSGLP